MKKLRCILFISSLSLLLMFNSIVHAEDQYKITANIRVIGPKCFITGEVKDASGNGVYPAEVTFTCGAAKTTAHTLSSGAYLGDPPPCIDFTITATAPGQNPVSHSGVNLGEDELLPLNLSFTTGASLEDAVRALQVLSGLTPDTSPPDYNKDNRIGLADVIYPLQVVAELRGAAGPNAIDDVEGETTSRSVSVNSEAAAGLPSRSMSRAFYSTDSMRATLEASMNVRIGRDTDGDGVDDWVQDVTTDENGYLEVEGLANGTYSLTASSFENSRAVRIENIRVAGSDVNLKTLRMKPVGSISGNVRLEGAEGAATHSDIHVLIPGTSFSAYTDSAGNFTISYVPEGTYNIKASKAGFGTIFMNDIPVEAGMDSGIESFMLTSVVGEVTGTVWLQGAVDNTGILITLRKDVGTTYLTTTNAAGEYTFQDIPTGDYELVATMPGYVTSQSSITVSSGSNDQALIPLSINSAKGTLTGTVTLSNFTDYSGILVSLAGTQYLAVTDVSGAYAITDIPEGSYTVFMKAEGYGAERFLNVQITTGKETTLDGSLAAATGTPYGSIVGTALYADKADYSGISVKLEGTDIPLAGTDTNGGFIVGNVPAGTYTLLFTQANYKTVTRTGIVVPPWETAFIRRVQMIPPVGNITGKVQLEGESSHDNVTVSVDGTSISAQSLADGSFLLEEVSEGTVNITAYKTGFETAHVADINVLPGQTGILEDPILLSKPPESPTGITATQASGTSVNVSWTASVSTDVAGYNVYYSTSSDQIDQKANTELIASQTDGKWRFEVTGLNKGVSYYFGVEAEDNDGLTSAFSQYIQTEIVPGAPTPPAPSEILEGQYPFIIPEAISLSRDGQRAYVTNPYNNVVSLIDLSAAEVVGTIVVGQHPADLAANPVRNEVYCVNRDSDTITVIDSTQSDPELAVIGTFNTAGAPVRSLVSPDGRYLFVSSVGEGADSVTVIDLDTGSEITESPISVGTDPQGMAIANNKLYVANEWENNLSVIDLDPDSLTRWQKLQYNIPVDNGPLDLATNQDGSFVYVVNSGSDTISVIDTATDLVIDTLDVGDYPIRMAVSGNMLYVTNWNNSNVFMINMHTNQVLATTFGVGNMPKGIAVTDDGETIYVVNSGSESVSKRTYGSKP